MKKNLLLVGILLCLQSCTFAINLFDLGNGYYVDIDSFKIVGNYGYANSEYHSPDLSNNMILRQEYDLKNRKCRTIKIYVLARDGRFINIIEEFELPKEIKKWVDIPEGSNAGIIFQALKYLDTNSH